jgi:hypothetical protein
VESVAAVRIGNPQICLRDGPCKPRGKKYPNGEEESHIAENIGKVQPLIIEWNPADLIPMCVTYVIA